MIAPRRVHDHGEHDSSVRTVRTASACEHHGDGAPTASRMSVRDHCAKRVVTGLLRGGGGAITSLFNRDSRAPGYGGAGGKNSMIREKNRCTWVEQLEPQIVREFQGPRPMARTDKPTLGPSEEHGTAERQWKPRRWAIQP